MHFKKSSTSFNRGSSRPFRGRYSKGRTTNQYSRDNAICEYCYIQSKTRQVNFRHPISKCPEMLKMHGNVNIIGNEDDNPDSEELKFDEYADEFFTVNQD